MLKTIASIFDAIASIFSSSKRPEKIIDEKAERMDIRNKVRAVRAELTIAKLKRRLKKLQRKDARKNNKAAR